MHQLIQARLGLRPSGSQINTFGDIIPLESEAIARIKDYINRDLPSGIYWYMEQFDFIKNKDLQEYLAYDFYSARYIYKIMEALNASFSEKEAHVKFQIIEYASIYEAVICYLLWQVFPTHQAVEEIEYHIEYRPMPALSSKAKLLYDSEETFICKKINAKTPEASISFTDKVDAAVKIGFIDISHADDIKNIYKLRNTVHTATAAKKNIEYEIEQSKIAYERMKPFIDNIKNFLNSYIA
jgi:hypothetical protein